MTRTVFTTLTALLLLACVPSLAFAKGPSEATITGPGLDSTVTVGPREPGAEMAPGAPVMELAEAAGFFPASFGQVPTPMSGNPPAGELGPRYTIEYLVPGPAGKTDRIVQDLYPFATEPVTYMEPGQPFFETERTRGGWYVGSAELTRVLLDAGLPESPPAGDGDGSFPWPVLALLAALALGAVVVATLGVRLRRRSQPAPAS
jgi:hypothetical protein